MFKVALRVMRTWEDSEFRLRLRAAHPASWTLNLVSRLLFWDRRYYAPSSQASAGRENTTSEQYRPRDQVPTTPAAGAGRVDTPVPPPCPTAPVSPAESDVSNESEGSVGPARHRSVPTAMSQFIGEFVHITVGAPPTLMDYLYALNSHGDAFPELSMQCYLLFTHIVRDFLILVIPFASVTPSK